MIFGTSEYFDDSITGKCWQKCICDAQYPDGSAGRIYIFADAGNEYTLGWNPLSRLYDLKLETSSRGNGLIAILAWRDVIEVKNEREIP